MLPCTAIAIANTGAVDSMTKVYLHVNSTAKWKLKLKARVVPSSAATRTMFHEK